MEPMRAIETVRLTLEPLAAAHAEEMFPVLSDPAIYEHENRPPPSVAWLRERYRRLEARRSPDGREAWLNWVVRLRTSEAIGVVQATAEPEGRAAVAYEIGSRHWGRGLGSEAVGAMIAELAARHGVTVVFALLRVENLRSLRLLRRLGFRPRGPRELPGVQAEPGEVLLLRPA